MDCFGFAHDETTENYVISFVDKKLKLDYQLGYGFEDGFENINNKQRKELCEICEDIFDEVRCFMPISLS